MERYDQPSPQETNLAEARRANTGNVPLTGASEPQAAKVVTKIPNEEGEDKTEFHYEDLSARWSMTPTMHQWDSCVDISVVLPKGGDDVAIEIVVEGKGKSKEGSER
ncbi:hypothetical protein BKA70DRAFT_1241550 [Coprinopsis sp. MPI-PUGE-AT-0042]|nr:hypothetical protein BKA70DRAFT_1241550 [Coprinopsis sp. MPI-PUGE-AT-0042]